MRDNYNKAAEPTVGSLFAGVGGFDRGFELAGFQAIWQVERDSSCLWVLKTHFPNTERFADVRNFSQYDLARVDLVAGGDPCPKHSRARSNGESNHPDLSGYFLAVVGRLKPEWVVRENVPAPSVADFAAALEAIGYGAVIIRIESSSLTGQLRQRDYIIGRYQATRESIRAVFSDCADGRGAYTTRLGTREIIPALTTHRTRYDSRDCYVWEPGKPGLRILDAEEREAAAGFPRGWTAGFSEATRARMCGNAVPPPVAKYLAERIKEVLTREVTTEKS